MKIWECYFVKVATGSMALGLIWLGGCDPDIEGKCYSNEECIENYLCNKKNQCVEVEQKNLEVLVEKLDDAIMGEQYSIELSALGGLKPYTWSILSGPGWLKTEKNTDTGAWMLVGEPDAYYKNAVAVELGMTDNSIGTGQTIASDGLSIRALYCLVNQEPAEACFGHGACDDEGLCHCNVGYAGNQCDECDQENGYELNDKDKCVRYEYKCEPDGICGADVMRRECVGDDCEGVEWMLYKECLDNAICSSGGAKSECIDCGDHGCSDGKCKSCDEGPCCEDGQIISKDVECAWRTEYECSGISCGAHGMEREVVQKCSGTNGGCDGEEDPKAWKIKVSCGEDDLCDMLNGLPVCKQCEHGCLNEECLECDPTSNGCCTTEGTLIAGCWYDPVMNLAWQNPPLSYRRQWWEAKNACSGLTLGDKSDWRLPSISELRSLIRGCAKTQVTPSSTGICGVLDICLEFTCWEPDDCACDEMQGPGQAGCYWDPELQGGCYETMYWSSSIETLGLPGDSWFVQFGRGLVYNWDQTEDHGVRCVRSGP